MTDADQTYTILKTVKQALNEQSSLQFIDLKEILDDSSAIKKLSDVLDDVEEETYPYSSS